MSKYFLGKLLSKVLPKQKTTGTEVIKNVGIAKNIDTKRAIQDKVTKTVDTAFKKADLPPSVRSSMETKNKKAALKRDEGKKLKSLSYRLDKLQEKVEKKAKGGRVGMKEGKLAVTPREKQLAAQYGDKKRITRGDVITIAKKKGNKNGKTMS